jgi:hypothetical protein
LLFLETVTPVQWRWRNFPWDRKIRVAFHGLMVQFCQSIPFKNGGKCVFFFFHMTKVV